MAEAVSTSITRRSAVAGLALTAVPLALAGADKAHAQTKQTTPEKSLYERLGGVFAIAAVVNHFSDAVVKNPIVGPKSWQPSPPTKTRSPPATSQPISAAEASRIASQTIPLSQGCGGIVSRPL